jgi:glucokinase
MTKKPLRLLAGDIGGTKTHLAIFSLQGESLTIERHQRYPTAGHASLNAIIRKFLGRKDSANQEPLAAACFGVPGPVKNGRAKPTNISWGVDGDELSDEFSIPTVTILNDLAANALGIVELKPNDLAVIQEGDPEARGNRCVVSPGTGLGEAGLFWNGRHHRVWASEGGHADFAPRNELEIAMLEYLIKRYGHVSYERIASGMGIENIYQFLGDTRRGHEIASIAAEIKAGDAGAVISEHSEAGDCPMCRQTIEIFISVLGAEAGNMALKSMALGGVYLGGGIPVKMLPLLRGVGFINAFNDKGRHTSLLESMPIKVILNDDAALLGAARHAIDSIDV